MVEAIDSVTITVAAGSVTVIVIKLGVGQASCRARTRFEVSKAILLQRGRRGGTDEYE